MRVVYVLLIFLWILCGCSSFDAPTERTVNELTQKPVFEITREFPGLTVMPAQLTRIASGGPSPEIGGVQPFISGPGPANPPVESYMKPYAFVRTTSPTSSMGQVYYSSGESTPEVIWNYGHSPCPSGDWVFFIQPPGVSPPGPARYNLITENVEYLDTSMVDPPCNYLVAADEGNTYFYGAISAWGADPLNGWLYIVKDNSTVWSDYGSYLFPALSSDGSTAAWCHDANPNSFGDRDPYVYDIDSQILTKIYDCDSSSEAQCTTLSRYGNSAAFSVAVYTSGGLTDQDIYWWDGKSSVEIETADYKWNEFTKISPSGKYLVWHANKNPVMYAGYSIMGSFEGTDAVELTTWQSSTQNLWPDVNFYGYVVYGNGVGLWSHYIPSLASMYEGHMNQIFDPGGICRDYKFAN